MKNKNLLFFLITPLLLASCSKGFIRYGVNPYIEIEKAEVGELRDVNPSYIKEKIDNGDSFLLLIHKTTCEACKYVKETYIYPFLEEHPILIYGMNTSDFSTDQNQVNLYQEIINPFKNFNSKGDRVVPYISVFENGNFINGELTFEFYPLFIETYVILD